MAILKGFLGRDMGRRPIAAVLRVKVGRYAWSTGERQTTRTRVPFEKYLELVLVQSLAQPGSLAKVKHCPCDCSSDAEALLS